MNKRRKFVAELEWVRSVILEDEQAMQLGKRICQASPSPQQLEQEYADNGTQTVSNAVLDVVEDNYGSVSSSALYDDWLVPSVQGTLTSYPRGLSCHDSIHHKFVPMFMYVCSCYLYHDR